MTSRVAADPGPVTVARSRDARVERGRFGFGRNWADFLSVLDEERIYAAEHSLTDMLETKDLRGMRFLDAGSGSGLFSLAARRLGAGVRSFDYDPVSVACAQALKARYFPNDPRWQIEQGSVLDVLYLSSLGTFDVVYAWGVLHHTGDMWQALDDIRIPLTTRGKLFIAIYNDQGARSRLWWRVKRLYCSGFVGRWLICSVFIPYLAARHAAKQLATRKGGAARRRPARGMAPLQDWHDWLGGFPFEVAKPEEIVDFYRERGLRLLRLKTTNSNGNNQFVFGPDKP